MTLAKLALRGEVDERDALLSVVVRIVGGAQFTTRCLDALYPQTEGKPIEILVPFDFSVCCTERLRRKYPHVRFLDMGNVRTELRAGSHGAAHELYDRRTSCGLRSARGEVVAIIEDYGVPNPNWCDQILAAHQLPFEVIGGAVEHSGRGGLNWAVYFLDFGRYQLPLSDGPADFLTDVNISYKRSALEAVKEVWWERYNEVAVNWALARKGAVLWRSPSIIVRQDRGKLNLRSIMSERVAWGRLFGCVRARETTPLSRLVLIVFSPAIPLVLVTKIAKKTFAGKRNRLHFLGALPQILMATSLWSLGEVAGYLTIREA